MNILVRDGSEDYYDWRSTLEWQTIYLAVDTYFDTSPSIPQSTALRYVDKNIAVIFKHLTSNICIILLSGSFYTFTSTT